MPPPEAEALQQLADSAFAAENYADACDLYSELLALLTGGSDPLADSLAPIYFRYGRCNYFLAQERIVSSAAPQGAGLPQSAGKVVVFEEEEQEHEHEAGSGEDDDELQTAWEALDCARVIYARGPGGAQAEPLADVLLALGDVSMEAEAFAQAQADYGDCARLLQGLGAAPRRLAEAFYKLAVAQEYANDSGAAKRSLEEAIASLQQCPPSEDVRALVGELQERIGELAPLAGTEARASSSGACDVSAMVRRK